MTTIVVIRRQKVKVTLYFEDCGSRLMSVAYHCSIIFALFQVCVSVCPLESPLHQGKKTQDSAALSVTL